MRSMGQIKFYSLEWGTSATLIAPLSPTSRAQHFNRTQNFNRTREGTRRKEQEGTRIKVFVVFLRLDPDNRLLPPHNPSDENQIS